MEKIIKKQENYKTGQWSGGTTTELAIYPAKAEYLDRDFIWRLSTAQSDAEESSFTRLPDFDRILMVLEGSVVLAHGDERSVNLGPLEQDAFDGAVKTKCFGNLKKDYNLIMRKGCRGRMEVVEAEETAKSIELTERKEAQDQGLGGECASIGIYCLEGYVIAATDDNTEMLPAGQQMIGNYQPGEAPAISVMGAGKCIFTEVVFEKQDIVADEITEADVTRSDFSAALHLSMSNNKWSKVMKKASRKGEWYAPALESKLRFLDKFMITFVIWAIGVLLCLCTMSLGVGPKAVFLIVILFSLVHVFLLRPLVYMAVLPKPIDAYIKKYSELNAYERQRFEEQIDYDPHQEKLMYKYRDRSGEVYKGRKDFISKLNKK